MSDKDDKVTSNQLFSSGPHGSECIFHPPPIRLLLSEYLPVVTSLHWRAEPLWSWYGTVALSGCRLGLLHPRGAAPPLADIPLSAPRMKARTRLVLGVARCLSVRCLAFFVPPQSAHPH